MIDLNDYDDLDLLCAMEAEMAKSINEVRAAREDLDKINGRLRFTLATLHILKNRLTGEE